MAYTIQVRNGRKNWRTVVDDEKKPVVVRDHEAAMDFLLFDQRTSNLDFLDAFSHGWRIKEDETP